MKNLKLVWSDDPADKNKLEGKKGRPESAPGPKVEAPGLISTPFVAIFRLEKNGRGGKTVTVIHGLPKHATFVDLLAKELKSKCGTGGTCRLENAEGIIEIQGDKREQIKKLFDAKGIKYKGM